MPQASSSAHVNTPCGEVNLSNKRIVLILPEALLASTDVAARTLCMSRLAFIRQALVAKLNTFQHEENARIQSTVTQTAPFVCDGVVWFPDPHS